MDEENHNRRDTRDRENGMFKDRLAWDRSEQSLQDLARRLTAPGVRESIVDFVTEHRGGRFVEWHQPECGGYNCCFRLEFDDGWATMRVPISTKASFADEKTRAEVAVMLLVTRETAVPVPHIYHWGLACDNPTGFGPFIIMDYLHDTDTLADVLKDPLEPGDRYVLSPALSDDIVRGLYGQMATILLQLDALEMPRIGSLGSRGGVDSRPLTQNIFDIVSTGGCPESVLPPQDKTYPTSQQFYASLADMHMAQLAFQHNDAVESADDAQDKYMARHLFRRLASEGRLVEALGCQSLPEKQEPFKLICSDLTPSNVLINMDGKVVAVIDWEFAYFGPSSIASSPPWWLLLQKPEYWVKGNLDHWTDVYVKYFDLFLEALEAEEERVKKSVGSCLKNGIQGLKLRGGEEEEATKREVEGKVKEEKKGEEKEPLSVQMRRNWETGAFWINWAAQNSYSFDLVYWKHIDERFFGENKRGGYEDRTALLSEDEEIIMEWVVSNKLGEKKERKLLEWTSESARTYLNAIIGRPRVL